MSDVPEGFDLEALLAPVSDEAPVGADLREDFSPQSVYYKLRDARSEARAAERAIDNGDPDVDTNAAVQPWRTVKALSLQALLSSKDLEVAAWYTEAAMRGDGLAGLVAGARLMKGFAEAYWDALYPMPDEDGMETRVAPVTGLNGEGADGSLIQPLRKIALFTRPDGSPLTFWQFEQSQETAGLADRTRREARLAAGVLPFDTVEAEARAAGATRLGAVRRAARAAEQAWVEMGELLDQKAGRDSPPVSRVRDLLRAMLEVAGRFAPAEAEASPEEVAAGSEGGDAGGAAFAGGDAGGAAFAGGGGGPGVARPQGGMTREDALRMLTELSNFFRKSEPHSPLAYTLEDAVRRGRMTWPELLAEVVPDETSRSAILTSLGIRPPQPEE